MKSTTSVLFLVLLFVSDEMMGVAVIAGGKNETHQLLDLYAAAGTFKDKGDVLDRLSVRYKESKPAFFVDLADYSRLPRRENDWTGDVVSPRVIVSLGIPEEELLSNILPILEGDSDARRSVVRGWLTLIDGNGRYPVPNIEGYRSVLIAAFASNKGHSPDHLIDYLFSIHPQTALRTLAVASCGENYDERRRLEAPNAKIAIWRGRKALGHDAKASKTDAIAELERCSRDDRWWLRLYVAKVIANEPELRTPTVVNVLRKDSNAFVREAVGQAE